MKNLSHLIANIIAAIFGGGGLRGVNSGKPEIKLNQKGQPTAVKDLGHIKKWEQLRLRAYMPTPHDNWTIGWGHTKTAKSGMEITRDQAEKLLRKDLKWVRKAIRQLVNIPLSQKQYDALAGLIFNIGRPNFASSTVLRRLNASDMAGAADAFLMWNKQRQNGKLVVLRGLERRRAEERRLFLEGSQ
jgi:lysozyme